MTEESPPSPSAPSSPLQIYAVLETSLSSSVPFLLASSPAIIRCPPTAQLSPSGSSTTESSAVNPSDPFEPSDPSRPLQMYETPVTSLSSRTPFRFRSLPLSIRQPPAAQFEPATSTSVVINAGAPGFPLPPPQPASARKQIGKTNLIKDGELISSTRLLLSKPPNGTANECPSETSVMFESGGSRAGAMAESLP